MTVTAFDFIHSGWGGKTAYGQTINDFTVQAVATVDDRDDGPQTIIDYSGTPDVGDSYAVGNETDTTVKLKELKCEPIGGMLWKVTLTYGDPASSEGDEESDQSGLGPDGTPSTDPLLDAETVEVFTIAFSRALLKATFRGAQPLGIVNRGKFHDEYLDKKITPQHSNTEVYDPPIEIDDSRLGFRIRKFSLQMPNLALGFRNRINDDQFTVTRPWGFTFTFAQHTALMTSITSSYRLRGDKAAWYTDYEIHYDEDTWDREYLDMGTRNRQWLLDTDDVTGNTISTEKAVPTSVRKDAKGTPLTSPSKSNGEGQPLTDAKKSALAAAGYDGAYLKYQVYDGQIFQLLQL